MQSPSELNAKVEKEFVTSKARFLEGTPMKHVIIMTLSSSIGLVSIFLVDLVDMYFLSLLGEIELASAIGYSGSILFFTTSICIGFGISAGALISKSIGSGNEAKAKEFLIQIYLLVLITNSLIALLILGFLDPLLSILGASGKSLDLSKKYLTIIIPSMPILGLAIVSGAALRAVGDAKRSMYSTLFGGLGNAVLDPIFIFYFDLGISGAALASFVARSIIFIVAFIPLQWTHRLIDLQGLSNLKKNMPIIWGIALPAILTNIATPVSNAFVTASIAKFGDSVVAGLSIVNRIVPVVFGVVYAVSGAVGPIIGQNYGAQLFSRVKLTLKDSYFFVFTYVAIISFILVFLPKFLGEQFSLNKDATEVVRIFCYYVAITFAFSGSTFIGNAAFNNLNHPRLSTLVNWGKATLGTFPFVYFGAEYFGAEGVIIGQGLGNILFGLISIICSFLLVKKMEG